MSIDFSQSGSCDGSAAAGITGALKGSLGMFGLGGLIPSDSDAQDMLAQAQKNYTAATTKWTNAISDEKSAINEVQNQYLQQCIDFSSKQQQIINQLLGEKIETNSLMIGMLFILIIFLILYDIL
jgi:hypothetical protein